MQLAQAAPSDPPPREESTPGLYRAGTLTYTKRALLLLCVWLLWGDIFFSFFEGVLIKILPLQLKMLSATDWIIGLAATTIPAAVKLVVGPIVSFRSDRCRSKWGRRRPYLMISTPFVALFLVGIGFAPEIGAALQPLVGHSLSVTHLTLAAIVLLVTGYHVFNSFMSTVYIYLFNDVVPARFLSTFIGVFRFIAIMVGVGFSIYVFPLAATHMREIYCVSAVLLLIMFGAMTWKVKEGTYPPPKELIGNRTGAAAALKTYFVECFNNRRYWYYFLASSLWALGFSITCFDLFLAQSLGATLKQFGWVGGITHAVTAVLVIPCGIISDRFHPVRVMLIAKSIIVLVTPLYLLLLFRTDTPGWAYPLWLGLQFVIAPLAALYKAAELPMSMRILPKDQYGQFMSAAEMVKSVALMAGGLLTGAYLAFVKGFHASEDLPLWHYRAVPVWTTVFYGLSLVFLYLLYRDLRKDPSSGIAQNERASA